MNMSGHLFKRYGLRGILLYFQLKSGITKRFDLPDYPAPLLLRPGTTDIPTFGQIFAQGQYEIELSFEPKIIIDAGANIGLSGVFFANRYPEADIWCIEPETNNYHLLCLNTKPYTKVTTMKNALWSHERVLSVKTTSEGEWAYEVEGLADNQQSIQGISLIQLMERFNLSHIDLLKMDIEGSEKEVFAQNYQEWLPYVRCLIIEVHDHLQKEASKNVHHAIGQFKFSCFQYHENLVFMNENFKAVE